MWQMFGLATSQNGGIEFWGCINCLVLSDENMDGVDSGETNQEDLTEDGMQQNESNADGSEDVIGGTEDAQ